MVKLDHKTKGFACHQILKEKFFRNKLKFVKTLTPFRCRLVLTIAKILLVYVLFRVIRSIHLRDSLI